MDAELRKRIEQTYSQAASDMEQKFNQYMKDFARKDAVKRDLVSKGLMSDKDYVKWRKGQIMIGERWKEMRDVLAQDLTNTDKIATSIINGYLPEAYALGHNYGTFQIERGSCINTSYSLYNREAVERLIKNEPRLLPVTKWEVNAPKDLRWNQQHITQQITQGILQGESLPQVAQRLQRVVGMDERAAMRNARTAITGAQNAGRIDAYKRGAALGIKVEKEWLATMDNVTRDSHVDLDGEHVPLDAQFSNGMDYPGGSGPPEEVYNCRCTVIPRLLDQDYRNSDVLRWRNEDDLGEMSWADWKSQTENGQVAFSYYNESYIKAMKRIEETNPTARKIIEGLVHDHSRGTNMTYAEYWGSLSRGNADSEISAILSGNPSTLVADAKTKAEGMKLLSDFVEGQSMKIHGYAGYDMWGNFDPKRVNEEKLFALDSAFTPNKGERILYKGRQMTSEDIEKFSGNTIFNDMCSSTSKVRSTAKAYADRAGDFDWGEYYPVVETVVVHDGVPTADIVELFGKSGMKAFEQEVTLGRNVTLKFSEFEKHGTDIDDIYYTTTVHVYPGRR